jgi:hypothetical protein
MDGMWWSKAGSAESVVGCSHLVTEIQLKRLLAEKAMEVDFLKGALQKVEARRQRSSGSGGKASTSTSEN